MCGDEMMHTEGETDPESHIRAAVSRQWLLPFLAVTVITAGAMETSSSRAAEPLPLCTGFCAPLPAKELESTRGAGNETQVGVILWDELRRQAAPPPPPPSSAAGDDNVSVHGPGSVILAGAKSR